MKVFLRWKRKLFSNKALRRVQRKCICYGLVSLSSSMYFRLDQLVLARRLDLLLHWSMERGLDCWRPMIVLLFSKKLVILPLWRLSNILTKNFSVLLFKISMWHLDAFILQYILLSTWMLLSSHIQASSFGLSPYWQSIVDWFIWLWLYQKHLRYLVLGRWQEQFHHEFRTFWTVMKKTNIYLYYLLSTLSEKGNNRSALAVKASIVWN